MVAQDSSRDTLGPRPFQCKRESFQGLIPAHSKVLGFEGVAVAFGSNDGAFYARLLIGPVEIDDQVVKVFTGRFFDLERTCPYCHSGARLNLSRRLVSAGVGEPIVEDKR